MFFSEKHIETDRPTKKRRRPLFIWQTIIVLTHGICLQSTYVQRVCRPCINSFNRLLWGNMASLCSLGEVLWGCLQVHTFWSEINLIFSHNWMKIRMVFKYFLGHPVFLRFLLILQLIMLLFRFCVDKYWRIHYKIV